MSFCDALARASTRRPGDPDPSLLQYMGVMDELEAIMGEPARRWVPDDDRQRRFVADLQLSSPSEDDPDFLQDEVGSLRAYVDRGPCSPPAPDVASPRWAFEPELCGMLRDVAAYLNECDPCAVSGEEVALYEYTAAAGYERRGKLGAASSLLTSASVHLHILAGVVFRDRMDGLGDIYACASVEVALQVIPLSAQIGDVHGLAGDLDWLPHALASVEGVRDPALPETWTRIVNEHLTRWIGDASVLARAMDQETFGNERYQLAERVLKRGVAAGER